MWYAHLETFPHITVVATSSYREHYLSTVWWFYSFEFKPLEVAQSLPIEHCSMMDVENHEFSAGDEGGIEAASILTKELMSCFALYWIIKKRNVKGWHGQLCATLNMREIFRHFWMGCINDGTISKRAAHVTLCHVIKRGGFVVSTVWYQSSLCHNNWRSLMNISVTTLCYNLPWLIIHFFIYLKSQTSLLGNTLVDIFYLPKLPQGSLWDM